MSELKELTSRACLLQLISTRMSSKQAMQRFLKNTQADITFEMLQVMSCLWDEQGISQQIIAERTSKDKACLTNLMQNLEKKGYICRKEDEKDKRNKLVYLTERGEDFKNWISPMLEQYYIRLEDKLGEEKLIQIELLLRELQEAIESY